MAVGCLGVLVVAVVGWIIQSAASVSDGSVRTDTTSRVRAEQPPPDSAGLARRDSVRKANLAALAGLRQSHDDFRNVTWYRDPSTSTNVNVNRFALYIGRSDDGGPPWLRLNISYVGAGWLFIESFNILADSVPYTIDPGFGEVERDNGGGRVWEWYDATPSRAELAVVQAVARSKSARLRYQGRTYRHERVITERERAALRRVLAGYRGLGGDLPAP